MKKRIFISYSRVDEAFAEDLENRLRAIGSFDVRRDRRVLAAGDDWWRQLQAEIDAADTLILCVSPESLKSDNVRAEWLFAKKAGIRVMPIAASAVTYTALPKWLARVHIPQLRSEAAGFDETWAGFVEDLGMPYSSRYAPFMIDPLPPDFVDRPNESGDLKRELLDESGSMIGITGVVGGGGFGKTTLAQALCHDTEVRDWFYDGILWLTLGEKADEDSVLAGARDLIKRITGSDATETTRDGVKAALRDAISDRYVLIVLDDVWSSTFRVVFENPGKNTRLLVTTRNPNLLPLEASKTPVDAMGKAEAHALLGYGLPDENIAELDKLAKLLGYWALLLKLANGQLHRRIMRGSEFASAIEWVFQAIRAKGLDVLANPDDPNARNRAASASLAVSIGMLENFDRQRFEMLAIFPEDTAIPLNMISRLWSCGEFEVEETCDSIYGLSLLLQYDLQDASIRLHDVVRTYLRQSHRESLAEWNRLFLAAFSIEHWAELPRTESYLWRNLAFHLSDSEQENKLRNLLTDFHWLQAKLDATDASALLADFNALVQDESLSLIQSAVRLSLRVLNIDKRQLALQLAARLLVHLEKTEVAVLIGNVVYPVKTFKSMSQHLPGYVQAGGALLRTLDGHIASVKGALTLPDGRLLSWARDNTLRLWAEDGSPLSTFDGHTRAITGALVLEDGRLLSWARDSTLRLWTADGAPLRTLVGHALPVTGALPLQGGRLLSWSDDNTLRLWAADGLPLCTLNGHINLVNGALELHDGRLLSWSYDNTLRLWAADGALFSTLEGHTDSVNGALALHDGRLLSWADDNTLRLWAADGALLGTLTGHTDSVNGALALHDGRLLSWADDNTLRLWAADGALLGTLTGHTDSVNGALVLDDGRLLSCSNDSTLRLWTADGSPIRTLEGHSDSIKGTLVLHDGRLLSWALDGTLRLWTGDGSPLRTFEGHTSWVNGALVLPAGRLLSWARDSTLRLWAADVSPVRTLDGHTESINGALVLHDGRLLSWADDSTPRLWATDGSPLRALEGHTDSVRGALALDDGRLLSWALDSTLRLWTPDGSPMQTLDGHTFGVRGALTLKDGRLLSWSNDCTLRLWAADGALLHTLEGHNASIKGAQVLTDGRLLSWAHDSTLRLWAADGSPLRTLASHSGWVNGAITLHDGRLLSWSHDSTLRLWAADGSPLRVLDGHTQPISGALVLDDGRMLSWSHDSTLRLWAADGSPLRVLDGHTEPINGALVLHDGRLLSWSHDSTLRLWAADGSPLRVLDGHTQPISGALVLDDGRMLSWSQDSTLRLWDEYGHLVAVFYGDAPITYGAVISEASLRVAIGDTVGRVIFLKLVE